jgi:hypothetical protein
MWPQSTLLDSPAPCQFVGLEGTRVSAQQARPSEAEMSQLSNSVRAISGVFSATAQVSRPATHAGSIHYSLRIGQLIFSLQKTDNSE